MATVLSVDGVGAFDFKSGAPMRVVEGGAVFFQQTVASQLRTRAPTGWWNFEWRCERGTQLAKEPLCDSATSLVHIS